MKYDYLENVKEDIKEYLEAHEEYLKDKEEYEILEELKMSDSITGNASDSYYCNAWKAEESLLHNMDLLEEALETFGYQDIDILEKGSEWCDLVIRCYLVGRAYEEVKEEKESE